MLTWEGPWGKGFATEAKDEDRIAEPGSDAEAKKEIDQILWEFVWAGAIDIGGIKEARWLEALVPLWVRTASSINSWNGMFKVLR